MERFTKLPILAVLHTADLFRNPAMKYPTVRDWSKVQDFLKGSWPLPLPEYDVYHEVTDELRFAMVTLAQCPYVVLDTEYTIGSKYLYLIGLYHPRYGRVIQFDFRQAGIHKWQFADLLRSLVGSTTVVVQNTFADIPVIESNLRIGYHEYRNIEDTMLGHAVLWSDWPHDLGFLASLYGKHPKMKHLSQTDVYLYNAGDCVDTGAAWDGISKEFIGDPQSKHVYDSQSRPLVPVLIRSMERGLRVNKPFVADNIASYTTVLEYARSLAHSYCGWPINIGSDDQLKSWLYDHEGLPVQTKKVEKNGKKVSQSTIESDAIAVLRALFEPIPDFEAEEKDGLTLDRVDERIADGAHPLLEARLLYSDAGKVLSNYLLPFQNAERIHPQFKIHAQASGRWSTTDPPLAQLPASLRDIVIPDDGERWISWDWDQIELRILAALSGDELYREAFNNGWDIHTLNACDIFSLPYPSNRQNPHHAPEDMGWRSGCGWQGKDDPRRVFAKRFVYRLNYGGRPETAGDIPGAKALGLGKKDLVAGSLRYLRAHPAIKNYWSRLLSESLAKLEVRTFDGRRRRIVVEGVNARRGIILNHPMQGAVAGIFNIVVLQIAERVPEAIFKYGMHDSQKWGVPEQLYESSVEVIKSIALQEWDIAGRLVSIPASFKE